MAGVDEPLRRTGGLHFGEAVLRMRRAQHVDAEGHIQKEHAAVATKGLPIILLSARKGEEAMAEGLAVGANDYFVKPFSARELVARVKVQLETRSSGIAAIITDAIELASPLLEQRRHRIIVEMERRGLMLTADPFRLAQDRRQGGLGLGLAIVKNLVGAALILGELLRMRGHEVVIAHDGPAALKARVDFQPEVALLDLGLPVMDGYELARQLRVDQPVPHLRLIAITVTPRSEDSVPGTN